MKEKPEKKPKPKTKAKATSPSADVAVAERDPRTLLGQILVELGYVTVYQLDEALHAQRTERAAEKREPKPSSYEQKPLGQIMLELGYCTPNQLIRAIQVQSDYRKAAVRFGHDW
jgi:hypothetical protein